MAKLLEQHLQMTPLRSVFEERRAAELLVYVGAAAAIAGIQICPGHGRRGATICCGHLSWGVGTCHYWSI